MYHPDRYFMKKLKKLDPNLGCEYNRNAKRFNITYKRATGLPVPIIQVKREDGGFRHPDQREINKLHESDTQRISLDDQLKRSSKYMQEYREKKAAEARENLRLMTIDDRKQLRRAVGKLHGPKYDASIFNKVTPKPKGKVF